MSYAQQEIAKIHLAKKQLGMDDETYRSLLESVAGVRSCRDLTPFKRAQVLERFKQLGFRPAKLDKGKKPEVVPDRSKLMDKIEAQLADAGLPWSYITATGKKPLSMLERITGKQRIEFCGPEDLIKIVAALNYHARRNQRKSS